MHLPLLPASVSCRARLLSSWEWRGLSQPRGLMLHYKFLASGLTWPLVLPLNSSFPYLSPSPLPSKLPSHLHFITLSLWPHCCFPKKMKPLDRNFLFFLESSLRTYHGYVQLSYFLSSQATSPSCALNPVPSWFPKDFVFSFISSLIFNLFLFIGSFLSV